MSLYTSTSRLCVSPRSKAYPTFLRRISASAVDSRPIQSVTPSSSPLRSPKLVHTTSKKASSFASLSLKPSISGELQSPVSPRVTSATATVTHVRSISLFAPRTASAPAYPLVSHVTPPSPLVPTAVLTAARPGRLPSSPLLKALPLAATGPPQASATISITSGPTEKTPLLLRSMADPSFPTTRQPSPLVSPALSVESSASSNSSSATPDLPSPTARCRRAPPPSSTPDMHVVSSPSKHTLDVCLPMAIPPEMVTITAKKGDRLDVVADAWHMESDCHYEWQIRFPPRDIDMSSVRAKFNSDGRLTIDVQRRDKDYVSLDGLSRML